MKVEFYKNDEGEVDRFYVSNVFLGRKGFVRAVEKIPELKVTRRPMTFLSWFREDCFCEFELDGVWFTVDEPFGDNSFYCVTCEKPGAELQLVARQLMKQKWPLGL